MFLGTSQQYTPIVQFSTEAEYIALYHCACEAVWLRVTSVSRLLGKELPVVGYGVKTFTMQSAVGVALGGFTVLRSSRASTTSRAERGLKVLSRSATTLLQK
jgi:hypothetical protein